MRPIQRLGFRARRFRDVRRLAILSAVGVVAGCASTGATLRSNHYSLQVPPDFQVVDAGGGQTPTLVRAPSDGAAPEVEVRIYAWLVPEPPADAGGDALKRLAATNALGLAAAHADIETCPDGATQFFLFGSPARAVHVADADGRHVVVTAGAANGSLVAFVGAPAPGASGCNAIMRVDAVIERLVASLAATVDRSAPPQPPSVGPGSAHVPTLRVPEP